MKYLTLQNLISMILLESNKPFTLIEPSLTSPPILGFIGSRNFNDFRKNINIVPRKWPPNDSHGFVHGGFTKKLNLLLKENKEIEEFLEENEEIIFTGHSLGGAIAILLASMLDEKKVKSVYTFGAPPLCSLDFKKYYTSKRFCSQTFRYVTPRDPVANLIPFYHHIGNQILLPYDDKSRLRHHDMGVYKELIDKMDLGGWLVFP